jgi:hypothetical protein
MVQVGYRFEMAGRAAVAHRFELAAFEVGELKEMFEMDVPHASPPKEGPTAHIPAMTKAFLEGAVPELGKAASSRNIATFAEAFEHAATMCNACHQASAKPFIQISSMPGHSVLDLDPLATMPGADR